MLLYNNNMLNADKTNLVKNLNSIINLNINKMY